MEKFRELILNLAENQPSTPLTEKLETHIQNRLDSFLDRYKTPDHPPYSAMIETALKKLNEKRGSTESSISQFLEREFDGLPWAHSSLLKLSIDKLCISGDIVVVGDRYKLVGFDHSLGSSSVDKKKPSLNRKRKWSRVWDAKPKRKCRKRMMSESDQKNCGEDELAEQNSKSGLLELKITEDVVNYVVKREEEETYSTLLSRDCRANVDVDDLIPEVPPGFEPIVVKNSTYGLANDYCHPKEEANVVGGEEICKSKRGLRQMRRWNTKLPDSTELKMKTKKPRIGNVRSPMDRKNTHDETSEQEKKVEEENYRFPKADADKGFTKPIIKTYQRRRKANFQKTEAVDGNFFLKSEKLVDYNC